MMCYRDRTYCPFYKKCNEGSTCSRALTKDIVKDAERIGLGISQFLDYPECFLPIDTYKEN